MERAASVAPIMSWSNSSVVPCGASAALLMTLQRESDAPVRGISGSWVWRRSPLSTLTIVVSFLRRKLAPGSCLLRQHHLPVDVLVGVKDVGQTKLLRTLERGLRSGIPSDF